MKNCSHCFSLHLLDSFMNIKYRNNQVGLVKKLMVLVLLINFPLEVIFPIWIFQVHAYSLERVCLPSLAFTKSYNSNGNSNCIFTFSHTKTLKTIWSTGKFPPKSHQISVITCDQETHFLHKWLNFFWSNW